MSTTSCLQPSNLESAGPVLLWATATMCPLGRRPEGSRQQTLGLHQVPPARAPVRHLLPGATEPGFCPGRRATRFLVADQLFVSCSITSQMSVSG